MALGILFILFVILGVTAIISQILLYVAMKETKYNDWIFLINMLLGLLASFLVFTGLPSNYIGQKTLALAWSLLAITAFLLKLKFPKLLNLSKALLTLSILGGLIQLFL